MSEYAQPVLRKSKWFAFIWSIPLFTAFVASFLLFDYYQNRGVEITIDFANGSGIVASKTKIRYDGIDIGMVESVSLIKGDNKVRVHARLNPSAAYLACKGTLFWVVQARFSSGGVSGLDTILSGKYINMRPLEGSCEPQTRFVGLNEPPMGDETLPGLFISLRAEKLDSLTPGTPVLFKQIKVGRIEGYELLENNEVKVFLYIEREFAHLVRTTTRFWSAGGVRVTGGLSGFKVQTESVAAMLMGGVTFDTPEKDAGEPVTKGYVFSLFNTREEALSGVCDRQDVGFDPGIIINVTFKNAEGLVSGTTEVKYKGITIGKVLDRTITDDLAKVRLTIMLSPQAGEATRAGTKFWVVKPSFGSQGFSGMSTLLSGRYIEVRPGNGERKSDFIGLEKMPLSQEGEGGIHLRLTCEDAGSISAGSPLLYRHIEVGHVAGVSLAKDGNSVDVYANVYADYAHFVKDTTRFWNSSGVTVQADMSGIKLQVGSLASLLTGGLEFETPTGTGKPVHDLATFTLYPDQEAALEWGRLIHVHFKTGIDLKAGAELRYRGVCVGEVKNVRLNAMMDGIVADIHVEHAHEQLIRAGSRFWVARPVVSLMGVEHLGAIIRGGHVEIEPGDGSLATTFTGLEERPLDRPDGLQFTLTCSRLGSLHVGSPIFYRNLPAGSVLATGLRVDGKGVDVQVMLTPDFARLVGDKTLFYRSGGVHVNASLDGFDVDVESLGAILTGGISYVNDGDDLGDALTSSSRVFLFESYKEAIAADVSWKKFTLKTNQTGSLTVGRPVYYRGIQVGQVLEVVLADGADYVLITIGVEHQYAALVRKTSLFWNASGIGLDVSLFGGAKMRTQSMDAIFAGGVAFINPEDDSRVAPAGSVFILHDKPQERWLTYTRKLPKFSQGSY